MDEQKLLRQLADDVAMVWGDRNAATTSAMRAGADAIERLAEIEAALRQMGAGGVHIVAGDQRVEIYEYIGDWSWTWTKTNEASTATDALLAAYRASKECV